ncbi:response regulator [Cellvibrio sp. UBA7661]|uniref:response regulator n=1 Tax=Cellvibrio sp. UBA7661 TaxID=1946311 RepID=UPI002F35B409
MTIKRALIVDDSTTAQYRLKKMLRRYPLDIDIVDSGEAALRYLSRHAPAVIFMDHLMPGIDGFRALQIIKSNPETAMIPVIMYTSKSGDVYTGQARALGALDVVNKERINATDLSKVMETIHIYPSQPLANNPIESPELIAAANQVSAMAGALADKPAAQPERRTASVEQARNLELRLSHMEHSLEDNRRFITSRVVRELQGLRQSLRQEFSTMLQQQPAATTPNAALTEQPQAVTQQKSGLSFIGIVFVLAALVAMVYLLVHITTQLNNTQQQQQQISQQLLNLKNQVSAKPDTNTAVIATDVTSANTAQVNITPPATAAVTPVSTTPTGSSSLISQRKLIDELAWTFNQNAALQFHQNTIDPQPLLRLHELLHRLASKGFKGTATVNIYVGDFCVAVDNMGLAQLAAANKTLGDCMLSSEIYTLARLMDDYAREATMMLGNLTRNVNSNVQIAITAAPGAEPYPERIPSVNAGEWNRLAQINNRLELQLTAQDEPY